MQYTEIFKLKEMLEKANIPFVFCEVFPELEYMKGYQIFYPTAENQTWLPETVCSVIQHGGSYGAMANKLEIMGLLTIKERKANTVVGWLTAENVFKRIQEHHKGVMKNENTTETISS